jgi:hypothetical protein
MLFGLRSTQAFFVFHTVQLNPRLSVFIALQSPQQQYGQEKNQAMMDHILQTRLLSLLNDRYSVSIQNNSIVALSM